MILIAQIKSIDLNKGTCKVHIPQFDLPNSTAPAILEAYICTLPGIYNGYNVDDSVWVAFEKNLLDNPVILGHLGAPAICDSAAGGAIVGKNLTISERVLLPKDVEFNTAETDFNSIAKIIAKLKSLTENTDSTGDLPTTLNSLQGAIDQYDIRIKNLEAHTDDGTGNPSTPSSPTGSDPKLSALTHSNISNSWPKSYLDDVQDFPIGKMIYVQNELNKDYPLWAEIPVYIQQSSNENFVEYTNSSSAALAGTSSLPGFWRVKSIISGGLFVQKCPKITDTLEKTTTVHLKNGVTCNLFDAEGYGLTWYWGEVNNTQTGTTTMELFSVRTADLTFLTNINSDAKDSDAFIIKLGNTVIQSYTDGSNNGINNIAILNLQVHLDTDGTNYTRKCKKLWAALSGSLFKNSTNLEYVIFNKYYRNADGNPGLNDYLFCYNIPNLREIFIPDNFIKIGENTFTNASGLSALRNLTNSHITTIAPGAFQNTNLNRLYLPTFKYDLEPWKQTISFMSNSLGNFNNHYLGATHIEAIFAHTKLNFDSKCFKQAVNGKNDVYQNYYTLEIYFPYEKSKVVEILTDPESNFLPFFQSKNKPEGIIYTPAAEDVTPEEKQAAINSYIAQLEEAGQLVDSNQHIFGTATEPTIIYNYKSLEELD